MTKQRFEIDSKMYGATDIRYWLKDNDNELVDDYGDEIYWGDGSTNGLKQIVNKLNELNDKCEFLEIENEALEDAASRYAELCHKSFKENERLREYNNKLMKQPLLFDVRTIPDTMEIMEANTKLEKENEQLKSILKEMVRVSECNGAISPMRVKSMVYNFIGDLK